MPFSVVVEIDLAAERIIDARSTRRLVPLELADVAVPPAASAHSPTVLFFRVLGRPDGALRVELWERGEFHGARALIGSRENPQLAARRVALAAAELGRRLARKRQAALARAFRAQQLREARLAELRERSQEGPRALRGELTAGFVPGSLSTFGSRLTGELSLLGPLRLDIGGELSHGFLEPQLLVELYGVSIGPGYRVALLPKLDIDFGFDAAPLLLRVPEAGALDDISHQEASWSARLRGSVRVEAPLSRDVRLLLGGELGALLRTVPYRVAAEGDRTLSGPWWGASLGLVVTRGP